MNIITDYFRDLVAVSRERWNAFWFTPADPTTLAVIRILAGAMLFYTHLVWTLDFDGFFGQQGRLNPDFVHGFYKSPFAWSHFFWIQSPPVLKAIHAIALAVFLMLTLGIATRITSWLAFFFTVSYFHRATGALFGLDQVNVMFAFYLALGPSGAVLSMDDWWRRRQSAGQPGRWSAQKYVMANIAIRLLQVHMCIIYLFAGLGKLQGPSWWGGTAMWLAFANYEYQTVDMTWMGNWPYVINLLTFLVLVWEIGYIALVWPRWTRPIMIGLVIPVHLGIAMCMGMITFGTAMLFGNLAFVDLAGLRDRLRQTK